MFIKLHTINDKEIRLNTNLIESYGVITEKTYDVKDTWIGYTYVVPVNIKEDENPYIVKETPEEIDKKTRRN